MDQQETKEITTPINALNPVEFYNPRTGRTEFGFVLSEVQQAFPFLLLADNSGVDQCQLTALLTKEVLEMKKQLLKEATEIRGLLTNPNLALFPILIDQVRALHEEVQRLKQ